MEFGNFADKNFVIFFSIVLAVTLILLFVIITYAFSVQREKQFITQLSYESTTTNIYVIDVKRNRMTYFNKSDMKNKTTSDLMSFYSRFHPNDVEKVKTWIFSICVNPTVVDQYLEADVLINNGKKPCFSLLKLLKYSPEVGLVHLESRVLKYITPNNVTKSKKNKKTQTGIVKRSQILSLISKNKSLRGYSYCVRFFYSKQKVLSNNKIERHMIMTLKNVIYPFASNNKVQRQILDEGGNELFLFDLKIANKEAAMQLATSVAHALRKQMEVNGFSGYISFAIGIVENGQYYQDFDTIIESCREACISGQTNDNEIVMHHRNISVPNDMAKYTEQIEHILKDDVLRYLFRPIIGVKNGTVLGYFEYVKAYDSPFSNFQEMSKYAARINKNIDLFANIAKHVIPKFVSECRDNNASLFLSVSMVDIDHIADIVGDIPASSKARITLIFDEQEVNENSSNVDLLSRALLGLKNKGYELALLLNDKDLLLDDAVYNLFDYFVVGSAMLGTIRKNNHIRLSTYTLIESLLKYGKPIIATDLESWQAVELIIKSGIEYISSEVVAASNDMLLPIEKKKMEKVISMAEKYL
ncbi:MAG: hypothetical protein K5925_06055 [Bacilli bacterium]|nr:hypothetical protein [Bacilli bacterium]